jgi:hypothetical protein
MACEKRTQEIILYARQGLAELNFFLRRINTECMIAILWIPEEVDGIDAVRHYVH